MKTKKVKSQYIFLILIVLFTFSCSDGEDGAIGPVGPQGEQGVNGQDGNANVVNVTIDDFDLEIGNNVIDIPELTQEIFDTGFVYGYVTVPGNTFWETLPLSLATDVALEIDRIEVGQLTLRSTFAQNLRFRFILVESSNVNSVDFSNFLEVKEYYNLKN
ncbi:MULTISPECIES: hypothetical protein [Aquimarina]|uniref:Collagen-like protein n=1 Tax=Aquimarina algiphila TaxID=2047982 RepID=A0A554VH49_9FLAO|nr:MULTISPECIES: hypothetical protein [Aquimarina]TSE06794.1 hypothetical protein FOF46_17915 [Aquimarina algiphila]